MKLFPLRNSTWCLTIADKQDEIDVQILSVGLVSQLVRRLSHPTENSRRPGTILPAASCTGHSLPQRDRRHRKNGIKQPVPAPLSCQIVVILCTDKVHVHVHVCWCFVFGGLYVHMYVYMYMYMYTPLISTIMYMYIIHALTCKYRYM